MKNELHGNDPTDAGTLTGRSTHLDPIPLQTFSNVQCSPFNWFVEQAAGEPRSVPLLDIFLENISDSNSDSDAPVTV